MVRTRSERENNKHEREDEDDKRGDHKREDHKTDDIRHKTYESKRPLESVIESPDIEPCNREEIE